MFYANLNTQETTWVLPGDNDSVESDHGDNHVDSHTDDNNNDDSNINDNNNSNNSDDDLHLLDSAPPSIHLPPATVPPFHKTRKKMDKQSRESRLNNRAGSPLGLTLFDLDDRNITFTSREASAVSKLDLSGSNNGSNNGNNNNMSGVYSGGPLPEVNPEVAAPHLHETNSGIIDDIVLSDDDDDDDENFGQKLSDEEDPVMRGWNENGKQRRVMDLRRRSARQRSAREETNKYKANKSR